MRETVYLALLAPIAATCSARWLARRLDPRSGTWLLTVSALLLAAGSGAALCALAATAIGQIPLVAAVGHYSVPVLRADDPDSPVIGLLACLVLVVSLGSLALFAVRRTRALVAVMRAANELPGHAALSVLDDPAPQAYALPGRPGRVVVSTGMLDALDTRERRVLLAHERAHLARGHHAFVLAAQLAAATNPLLRPLATAVSYTVERWADEHAARTVGDRVLVARTVGKAALLAKRHGRRSAITLAGTGGPVPQRVAALLAAPPRRNPLVLAIAVGTLIAFALCTLDTAVDLHSLFELAQAASR